MDNNNFFFTLKSDSIAVLLLTIHLRLEFGISSNELIIGLTLGKLTKK